MRSMRIAMCQWHTSCPLRVGHAVKEVAVKFDNALQYVLTPFSVGCEGGADAIACGVFCACHHSDHWHVT